MRSILLGLCVVLLSACGGNETAQTPKAADSTASTVNTAAKANNELGAKIYQSACMACHSAQDESGVAPPIFGVKDHVMKAYPDRATFVKRVASWIKAPDAKDVLMPGAVQKFGLMPAMPQLTDAEAQAVAEFLFDVDLKQPDWYTQHYQAEHGKAP